MKVLSLGLTGSPDELRTKLQQDCRALIQEGFRIAIDETSRGNYTFLGCNIAEGELSFRNYERIKNMLKNYVSHILADRIITNEEKVLIRKLVNRNYYYFSDTERETIYGNALTLLDSSGLFNEFSFVTRRNKIVNMIQDYLDNHHELVLDGFVAFRLKDYRAKLAEIVDKAVDEYMMDLEYQEFIRVLRYFVDVQEAQVDEVHVIVDDSDNFKLRDSAGKVINNQYLETFMMKNTGEINYEDLLISALITIAPQNILLHNADPDKTSGVLTTIKNVFEDRVIICNGCEICRPDTIGHNTP